MVGIVGVGRVKKGKRPASEDTPVILSTQGVVGCCCLRMKVRKAEKDRVPNYRFRGHLQKIPHGGGEPVLSSTITLG